MTIKPDRGKRFVDTGDEFMEHITVVKKGDPKPKPKRPPKPEAKKP